MNRRQIRRTALLLALVFALTSALAVLAETTAIVTRDTRIYAAPTTQSKSAELKKGWTVEVLETGGSAAKVKINGVVGYTYLAHLEELDANGAADDGAVYKTFTVEVSAENLPVYKSLSTASKVLCTLPKGTKITCRAYNDTWAVLEYKGNYGACLVSGLSLPGENSTAPEPESPGSTPEQDGETVYKTLTVEVSAQSLPVYKSLSTSSKVLCTLPKGTKITCRAYNKTWAVLEYKGNYGACLVNGLTLPGGSGPTEEGAGSTLEGNASQGGGSSAATTLEEVIASGKYSNEEVIFYFLTKSMGLNTAAACGILANIKNESSFRPTAYNSSGGSYGICQWTGSRFTRLKNYCADKGYDYKTLEAQLWFLKYELENHYTKTLKYMRAVENSASGAYDAGHYWCYNFEVPANRASVSVKRGNLAKDTYWAKYA